MYHGAAAQSPRDVQVLTPQSRSLDEDLLGAGAVVPESLLPRVLRGRLEEGQGAVEVDRSRLEVPGSRRPTNPAVAQRSASTAGDHEARVDSQEEEDVAPSVRSQALEESKFTWASSACVGDQQESFGLR